MKRSKMELMVSPVVYITGAPLDLLAELRTSGNSWADGDDNICLSFEEALTFPELAELLVWDGQESPFSGCDVIVS